MPSGRGRGLGPAMDGEEQVPCPYDKSHLIRVSRLPYHLVKCQRVRGGRGRGRGLLGVGAWAYKGLGLAGGRDRGPLAVSQL